LSSLISLGVTFCSSVNYSFILTEYISYLDRTIVLIALLGCSLKKILALDQAIKSNNRSDYITKLTNIAYLPEKLGNYKKYVLENYGSLDWWDEEEDFTEYY
jgi:hypothetical protein